MSDTPALAEGGFQDPIGPEHGRPRQRVVGVRIGAALIDAIPLSLLLFGMARQFGELGSPGSFRVGLYGWAFVAYGIVVLVYFTATEAIWGTSPGKLAMGLQVTSLTGKPITWGQSLVRNVVRFVDWFPIFYPVGMLAIATSKRDQRLGDRAAKTVVVRWLDFIAADSDLSEEGVRSRPERGLLVVAVVVGLAGMGFLVLGSPSSVTGPDAEAFVYEVADEAFRSGSFEALSVRSWDVLVESPEYEESFNGHIEMNGLVVGSIAITGIETGDIELVRSRTYPAAEYWMDVSFATGPGILRVTIADFQGKYVVIGWRAVQGSG